MIVVLLAGRLEEARDYAVLTGVAKADVVLPGRENPGRLTGLRLEDGDLIVEFSSFVGHPHEERFRADLTAAMGDRDVIWHRVTAT